MKEGDKIYCIKKNKLFKVYRSYYIIKIYEDIPAMYVLDDTETGVRQFCYKNAFEFKKFFCSLKNYRKLKLESIDNYEN